MFATLPTLNAEYWQTRMKKAYQCNVNIPDDTNGHHRLVAGGGDSGLTNDDCSLHINFIINEMLFRLFVPITLINIIFKILAILFKQSIHSTSFKGISAIMHPCSFVLFMIGIFFEISVMQAYNSKYTDNKVDGFNYMVWNIIWMFINGLTALILLLYTYKSQSFELDSSSSLSLTLTRSHIDKTAFIEGTLLILGRSFVIGLTIWDKQDKYSSWRQLVITFYIIIQAIAIIYFKKPNIKTNEILICCSQIDLNFMFYWIIFLNAYNLTWSIIFEIDHFSHFIDEGSQVAYMFLIEFSVAFCVLHSDLWALSQFIDFSLHYNHHKKKSISH